MNIPTYKTCMNLYPQVLFFILLILCYIYHVSYAYAFIGCIANMVVINSILKEVFRNLIGDAGNRPDPNYRKRHMNVFDKAVVKIWPSWKNIPSYGFPSGHAQSVGYLMAFANEFMPWRMWHPGWIVTAILIAIWLMHSRIVFRYHTVVQVLAGFVFGIITFQAFHLIWTA